MSDFFDKRKSFIPHIVSIVIVIVVLFSLAVYVENGNLVGEAKKGSGDDSVVYNEGPDTVYEFTFNTKKWELESARTYTQSKDKTSSIAEYEEMMFEAIDYPLYSLIVQIGKNTYTKKFSPDKLMIAEGFDKKENRLVSVEKSKADKVSLRFPFPTPIKGEGIQFLVLDFKGNKLAQNFYKIKFIKGKSLLELIGGIKSTVPIQEPEDEGPIRRVEEEVTVANCPDLHAVDRRQNVLGENRINIIFYGVGFLREVNRATGARNGPPEFARDLISLIDFSSHRGSPGLFGEEPFKSNKHLFNIWYSDRMYNPVINAGSVEEMDSDPDYCEALFDARNVPIHCPLSNILPVYLINNQCRDNTYIWTHSNNGLLNVYLNFEFTETPQGYRFLFDLNNKVRRFVHEIGHAAGNLADEYTEDNQDDIPRFPNCLDKDDEDIAHDQNWPNIFEGCSYEDDNIRSSFNSIMNIENDQNHFEEINERHLCYRFGVVTGQELCGSCGTCRNIGEGQPCNSHYECQSDICWDDGKRHSISRCQPINVPSNGFCLEDRQCPRNHRCLSLIPPSGTTSPPKYCLITRIPEFGECQVSGQCSTLNCVQVLQGRSKVCLSSRKEEGESCLIDSQCLSGKCRNDVCSALKRWGESCTSHGQCAGGVCANRRCY